MFRVQQRRKLHGIFQAHVVAAAQATFHYQQASAVGRLNAGALRAVRLEVHAIVHDRDQRPGRSVPILPPLACELALVYDSIGQAPADER